LKQGQSGDEGRAFFLDFAAKQTAIFRGLGYKGVYFGGVHDVASIEIIIEIERSFSPDNWKEFAKELRYSRHNEYYYYPEDQASGLADASGQTTESRMKSKRAGFMYGLSKLTHDLMFTPGTLLATLGARICSRSKDSYQGPGPMRALEGISKSVLFSCKDCGDCSLPDTAFLCPESQCAKNQRNGPCGGTHDGRGEVDGYGDCIWLRAYERLKHDGKAQMLLEHSPVIQDQGLRGTSSWANNWLGRDHATRRAYQKN
jgi:methylenetetrahydrofolate reductase (NADPH)